MLRREVVYVAPFPHPTERRYHVGRTWYPWLMPDVWSAVFINAVSIPQASDNNTDLDTRDFTRLTVTARMTTTTAADLVMSVRAYDASGTLIDVPLVADESVAPTVTGSVTYAVQEYDLSGIDKVQLRVRNAAAAAARTTTASYFGSVD